VSDAARALIVERMGLVPYALALDHQHALRATLQQTRPAGSPVGRVLLLEHPAVVTLGKRGKREDLSDPAWLDAHDVPVFEIDRGGEATFHEPGQLVIYPVIHLESLGLGVVDVVHRLCDALIATAARWRVSLRYDRAHPGLWTDQTPTPLKVASVGMRASGGVSTHGAAINLTNELVGFSKIVACGMTDAPIARLIDLLPEELRGEFSLESFREALVEELLPRLGAVEALG
jgi:lipoate-protein ligase B